MPTNSNRRRDVVMQPFETSHKEGKRQVETLAPRQRQLIRQALTARFGAFLKPGESIDLAAEKSDEYVYAKLTVSAADESFQLDVEAAVLAADQDRIERFEAPEQILELAIEFLKRQTYDFFRSDRDERFHVDWRIYPVDKATVRFRGQVRRPELERRADDLLEDEAPELSDD
ncbi:MAG: hypothetical protein ACOCV2_01315 [Persicimonas sp.]